MLAWRHPIPAYLPNVWCDMRVSQGLLGATVFVGLEHNGVFSPCGSALVGGVTIGDLNFPCLVTAKHVVEDIPGETVSVRMNRRSGEGCETVRLSKAIAFSHENELNDLVIFPFSYSPEIFELSLIPLNRDRHLHMLSTQWQHNTGDEVCVIGLYTSHYGRLRNSPVVRTGNIAAMPDEPVRCHKGYVQAYLIELRSIAGLSGSPVYTPLTELHIGPDAPHGFANHSIQLPRDSLVWQPLGILIGYHVVESKEDQISVPRHGAQPAGAFDPDASPDERNTGFGVVIPIERVFDILEREDVMAQMKAAAERHFKEGGFRKASAPPPATKDHAAADSEANPAHREDFKTLVGAASKKKPQAD